jgi:hypothetical protein
MWDLSIFCSLSGSLFSGVCNSPCRGHSHSLLCLLLGIWLFWGYCKWNFFHILSLFVCCWCIEKLMIFVSLFFILPPCYSCLWCLRFFGSLRYRIISSANKDILTVSLPICIPFISSSCLIALAHKSSTILNRSGDSVHPCLIPDFRWNGFSFSPFSMILTVGLSYITLTMLRYIPSILYFLGAFIMKWCLILFICFCVFSYYLFLLSWNFLSASCMFWLTMSINISMKFSLIICRISSSSVFLCASLDSLV